jgi:hypothetical protein
MCGVKGARFPPRTDSGMVSATSVEGKVYRKICFGQRETEFFPRKVAQETWSGACTPDLGGVVVSTLDWTPGNQEDVGLIRSIRCTSRLRSIMPGLKPLNMISKGNDYLTRYLIYIIFATM